MLAGVYARQSLVTPLKSACIDRSGQLLDCQQIGNYSNNLRKPVRPRAGWDRGAGMNAVSRQGGDATFEPDGLPVIRIVQSLRAMERMVLLSQPFWGEDCRAMRNSIGRVGLAIVVVCGVSIGALRAQQGAPLTQEQKDQRVQTEKELESVAIIERKVMVPMRDGAASDGYLPAEKCNGASADYLGAHALQF